MDTEERTRLFEVARLFLKLGVIGFGGPAAHIALMRGECVQRRKWLTDERFLDLYGASSLIPGPSSTELAIFLGYLRAGPAGLVVAGTFFILPAMLMVLGLAWLYTRYGTTPAASDLLYGIKPVVIAVVVQAIWGLARTALRVPLRIAIAVAVALLFLLGVNPIALLAGAVVVGLAGTLRPQTTPALLLLPLGTGIRIGAVGLPTIFLTFLKIGAVTYGSGYVLLAFLQDDLVRHTHWLTSRQLLDAVAVGQVTPGPVFTTATFLGYLLHGVPGALLATLAIFLPGFILVALVYPLLPRIRASRRASAALDAVNAAALGLMAGVSVQLVHASLTDAVTGAIAAASFLLLLRGLSPVWLIAAGGAIGLIAHLV